MCRQLVVDIIKHHVWRRLLRLLRTSKRLEDLQQPDRQTDRQTDRQLITCRLTELRVTVPADWTWLVVRTTKSTATETTTEIYNKLPLINAELWHHVVSLSRSKCFRMNDKRLQRHFCTRIISDFHRAYEMTCRKKMS